MSENPEHDQPMPLVSHLTELRTRLLRCIAAIFIIFAGLFAFTQQIYTLVSTPLREYLPVGATMIATDLHAATLAVAVKNAQAHALENVWFRRGHWHDALGNDRFDMIVAMDDMNYESLNRLAPSREAARKIFRMAEFCRRHPDRTYVPDPYYEGHEGFELVLDMLEDGCEGILEYLSENGK